MARTSSHQGPGTATAGARREAALPPGASLCISSVILRMPIGYNPSSTLRRNAGRPSRRPESPPFYARPARAGVLGCARIHSAAQDLAGGGERFFGAQGCIESILASLEVKAHGAMFCGLTRASGATERPEEGETT